MSIADKLGTGSSFSQVPRHRSARGRAKAVTQGDVPAYELVRLQLQETSPTPLNPRRNFGSDDDLTRFGEELRQVQLAACVAVTRDAYLALWPDHEPRIGSALHVLVNGERRYRSAVHVGLEALDFVVRDDLAASREQFINHLLKENLDREDFDVIERARGVQQLVEVCAEKSERGARSRAAEQLGRDRSWVTNQLTLLDLPAELQAMLSTKSLAERDGRVLARYLKENPGLDAAALLDHHQQVKAAEAGAKEQEKAVLEAARSAQDHAAGLGLLSADNKLSEPDGQLVETAQAPETLSADNKPSEATTSGEASPAPMRSGQADTEPMPGEGSSALPSQRHEHAEIAQGTTEQQDRQPRKLPYDDPTYVVQHLHVKMTTADFAQGARAWLTVLRTQHPEEYQALLLELAEEKEQA
ncbi:ParB/RepB/Spo0J family partition protein [Streptomyces cadmiisoli]|uniref:ParB/RepB/Spo0J family partition protein n=1 Tax=Streptomyces cadmiisoli TaxID=2184053 RepID=UPI003659CD3B